MVKKQTNYRIPQVLIERGTRALSEKLSLTNTRTSELSCAREWKFSESVRVPLSMKIYCSFVCLLTIAKTSCNTMLSGALILLLKLVHTHVLDYTRQLLILSVLNSRYCIFE